MRRAYGSGHLYVKSGAYYVRWRAADGRVLVPDERRLGAELDAILDDHAARNAEVVLLEIGADRPGACWTVAGAPVTDPGLVPGLGRGATR